MNESKIIDWIIGVLSKIVWHTREYTVAGGLVLFTVAWPFYFWVAFGFWVITTSLDIAVWWTKARYFFGNDDSRILWKSIFKRALIALLGILIAVLCWHVLAIVDRAMVNNEYVNIVRLVIALFPIGYFHLFALQELSSLFEHRRDMDPDNPIANGVNKLAWLVRWTVVQMVDTLFKKRSNRFYEEYSPDKAKKYLNREIENDKPLDSN